MRCYLMLNVAMDYDEMLFMLNVAMDYDDVFVE